MNASVELRLEENEAVSLSVFVSSMNYSTRCQRRRVRLVGKRKKEIEFTSNSRKMRLKEQSVKMAK